MGAIERHMAQLPEQAVIQDPLLAGTLPFRLSAVYNRPTHAGVAAATALLFTVRMFDVLCKSGSGYPMYNSCRSAAQQIQASDSCDT